MLQIKFGLRFLSSVFFSSVGEELLMHVLFAIENHENIWKWAYVSGPFRLLMLVDI